MPHNPNLAPHSAALSVFPQRIPLSEAISSDQVPDFLGFTEYGRLTPGITRPFSDSLKRSHWFSLEKGRVVFEIRHPEKLMDHRAEKISIIRVSDYDDCLMSATRWHQSEFEKVSSDPRLVQRGIAVEPAAAKILYEKSKIFVPGKAVGEKRYTPRLNLVLLSVMGEHLSLGTSPEQAIDEVEEWRQLLLSGVALQGDTAIKRQTYDHDFMRVLLGNSPKDFVYHKFATDVFSNTAIFESGQTRHRSLNIIATRGNIEGPLGQVHKVHSSGVLTPEVDMVVYTNDLKAETLIHAHKLLPKGIQHIPTYVFDDNTAEIIPYIDAAASYGIDKLRVVQVSHPDAKRKNQTVNLPPRAIIGDPNSNETVLRYFFSNPNQPIRPAFI